MQRNPVFRPLCPLWCQHSRLSAETKQGSVHVAWSVVAEMFLYFQLYLEDRAMMGDSLMFESIVFWFYKISPLIKVMWNNRAT